MRQAGKGGEARSGDTIFLRSAWNCADCGFGAPTTTMQPASAFGPPVDDLPGAGQVFDAVPWRNDIEALQDGRQSAGRIGSI